MLKYLALGAALIAGPIRAEELPLAACPAPVYSPEALRYLMEGDVRLDVTLLDGARAGAATVSQSSGYQLLDRASVALVENCAFKAPAGQHTLVIPWRLPADATVDHRPQPAPGQCKSKFRLFNVVGMSDPARNMSVRVQVWPDGQAFTPKIEQSSGDPEADKIAVSIVESCRFDPATRGGEMVRGATIVGLAFDREGLSAEKIAARYDKLAAYLAGQRDYRIAHILVKTEQEARAILAELLIGTDFAELAKARSIDPGSKKNGGLLQWQRATDFVKPIPAALAAQDAPGLIREPLKTVFGWHVIRVDETRPSTAPPLDEELKKLIRNSLIKEARPNP